MSRRMIYLCYGEPASGKSMLTRHLDRDKVYVCELFHKEAGSIRVQIQQALQKFYPQPIKFSDKLKDGVEVVLFEVCDAGTKKFAQEILEEAVKNMACKPGFTVVDFAVKVRGDKR